MNIYHHELCSIALDAGMLNASLLAKRFSRNPIEFLMLDGSQPRITQIAESNGRPLGAQWQDSQVRIRSKPDFLRALETSQVIRRVAGSVGGHARNARGVGGNGPVNYGPGLWMHQDLALDLARWLECRGESWRSSPLANFIEKVLSQTLPGDEA